MSGAPSSRLCRLALLVGAYVVHARQYGVLPFALLRTHQCGVAAAANDVARKRSTRVDGLLLRSPFATLGGWNVAATLALRLSIATLAHGHTPYASWPGIAIAFVIATILATMTLTWLRAGRWSRLVYAVDGLAVAIFAIASWRRNLPLAVDDHHVSFFVGPVEAVRQGHWLLWDLPSQYGVANIWLIGHLPARNGYEAFAYANIVFIFCAQRSSRTPLRESGPRRRGRHCFALPRSSPPNFFVGGALNDTGHRKRRTLPEHRCDALHLSASCSSDSWSISYARGYLISHPKRVLMAAGSVVWLAACWWSAEAAIFETVIWLPSAIALMWLRNFPVRVILRHIAVALGALLITVVFVELVYFVALGHGPDWFGFVEFGLLYGGGYGGAGLTTFGGVWLLISTFAMTFALALYCWYAKKLEALPLMIAAAAAQWATASYFVVRSADNNVDNLLPVN